MIIIKDIHTYMYMIILSLKLGKINANFFLLIFQPVLVVRLSEVEISYLYVIN